MIFFIGWIGYYYPVLVGHECSCFPLIKRTVGPGFFIGDGVMLLMGLAAFGWSPRGAEFPRSGDCIRSRWLMLAGISFGANASNEAMRKCRRR